LDLLHLTERAIFLHNLTVYSTIGLQKVKQSWHTFLYFMIHFSKPCILISALHWSVHQEVESEKI